MTGTAPPARPRSGALNLAVDYGPIAVFFVLYRFYAPSDHASLGEVTAVIRATAGFMAAAVIALAVSKWKLGKISPMLWLSTALIVVFGGLTILFQDKTWIQIKPTVIYLLFGITLLIGVARGVPLLRTLLQAAFEGLDDRGWMILSRNWGWFFLFLAALNEALRHWLQFGDWIAAKLWLFLPLTFLFTFAHIPMLLRHGLAQQAEEEVITTPPHD
ncbi:MAG: septation protein IspZ [Proteobacteria bacterium]|nr:septation protein IspZ [Pseudomonadota bacterium]